MNELKQIREALEDLTLEDLTLSVRADIRHEALHALDALEKRIDSTYMIQLKKYDDEMKVYFGNDKGLLEVGSIDFGGRTDCCQWGFTKIPLPQPPEQEG